jgi:threonine/homoserine/homoserine lactone efflux protein
MKALELLLRGVLAGLAIAIPVGPVNVLCISRTITGGRRAGIVSGLGAATADALYGAIAAFSITVIIDFLMEELFWIRTIGGILLIGIGLVYWFKKPRPLKDAAAPSPHSAFATTLLLTLTNPTPVLSFLAVLAGLRLGQQRPWPLTMLVVAGIFCGSMLWWIVLAMISGHFRRRFNDRAILWMNRIGALAIGAFGVLTMVLAVR